MILKFEEVKNTLVVKMAGELDHHTSEIVRIKIDNKLDERNFKNIIFDFSQVNFMDSSGIGVVIGRYKKVSQYGGKAVVVGMRDNILKVFDMAGLFKIIEKGDTIEKAISNL